MILYQCADTSSTRTSLITGARGSISLSFVGVFISSSKLLLLHGF